MSEQPSPAAERKIAAGRANLERGREVLAQKRAEAAGVSNETREEPVSFPESDPGEVLQAMKHVLTQSRRMDKTELQKLVRAAKEEKPFSFLQEYQKRRDVGKDKEVKDDGTAVAVELVERLLQEFEGRQP